MPFQLTYQELEALAPQFRGRSCRGSAKRVAYDSVSELIVGHFKEHSELDHPCIGTLSIALSSLDQRPANIIETGSSAWGTNSSLLFDSYVNSFGGSFQTVDIRLQPLMTLPQLCSERTTVHCDDSVTFLGRKDTFNEHLNLIYLDSWDVDIHDPLPSALHGLHEFLTVLPYLRSSNALLLVDDTPLDFDTWFRVQQSSNRVEFQSFVERHGFAPGKGGLIKAFLEKVGFGELVAHDYQLLWKF